jgi:acyl-coenzyme A thioesterase PaaI-like protein
MHDRRRIRNHLNCIHAIALMNLGEFTTGLAVVSTLSEKFRYILVHLEIDFLKKARGTLEASAAFSQTEPFIEQKTFVVESEIKNEAGESVAKVRAHWLVGPKGIA